MNKLIVLILLTWSCSNPSTSKKIAANNNPGTLPQNKLLFLLDSINSRKHLYTADSVILASHYPPDEPILDERTDKLKPALELVNDGKLNPAIVKERKKLRAEEAEELGDILFSHAGQSNSMADCFVPRNGIFVYHSGKLTYIDVCFECHRFSVSPGWGSGVIFDSNKYARLMRYYERHGFTYMLKSTILKENF